MQVHAMHTGQRCLGLAEKRSEAWRKAGIHAVLGPAKEHVIA
jgi:hypothetical protein